MKSVLITGTSKGIGLESALAFGRAGYKVFATMRNPAQSPQLAETATREKLPITVSVMDVDSDQSVVRSIAAILKDHGPIDVLVNNAGINVFADPLKLSEDDWARCLSVDLEGAWHCARAVLPHMLARGAGSIVNIASVHGHKIIPGAFPYPVAKHGLIGLTRALGIEYAARGIRVNSISPGLILTPIAEAGFAAAPDPEAERRRQAELLPCKRIGEPEEVAYTALFLASDEARFINATDILIDGGRSQLYHE